jgi:phospholipid/cholesterol/gamma-HCH transport system substrate-binding protein
MKRNMIETVLGAVVLLVAVVFLGFSYSAANVADVDGYTLTADFTGTGGLGVGDTVQISGVAIGTVAKIELRPDDYRARVTMKVDDELKLPDDTSALISSEGLLGGKYMELQPGASEEFLSNNGHIQYTQAPQNLEQLLGKFIFSMEGGNQAQAAEEAPIPAGLPSEDAAAPQVQETEPLEESLEDQGQEPLPDAVQDSVQTP